MTYNEMTLYEVFKRNSSLSPAASCILFRDVEYSYEEVLIKIDKTAEMLQDLGVVCGSVVVFVLPNLPELVYLIYACNKLRAIAYPTHALSTPEQLGRNLKATGSKIVFAMSDEVYDFAIAAKDNDAKLFYLKDYLEMLKGADFEKIKISDTRNVKDASVLFNSSGTTGASSIVEISDYAINSVCECSPSIFYTEKNNFFGEYISAFLPMFHCFGTILCVHGVFCHGGCAVIMPKFDRDEIIKHIAEGKMTYFVGVPAAYQGLLGHNEFFGSKLKGLKVAIMAGDVAPHKLFDDFNDRMLKAGSQARIVQGYGLSETTTACFRNDRPESKPYSCGRVLPFAEFKIFDEEENILKDKGVGEIYVAGESLFNGYLNAPEVTKACTYYDESGVRYVKTGDIVEIDDEGYMTFKARKKRLIKVKGFSIFPSQIEQLAISVEGVAQACAIGVPCERSGSLVVLFYVAKSNDVELLKELKAYLTKNLQPEAFPAKFICLDSLPLTPLNKVDTIKLSKMVGD